MIKVSRYSKNNFLTWGDLIMTFKYVNKKNIVYYLQELNDDQGNKNYFFTKQKQVNELEKIPEGYNIFEDLDGKVILRKNSEKS